MKENGGFPEVFEIFDDDTLKKYGVSDYETFDELETAKKFMELFKQGLSERDIEIYTQVDGDRRTYYLRGIHVVNRTGVYLVAWK